MIFTLSNNPFKYRGLLFKNTVFPLPPVLFSVFSVTCFQGPLKILNGDHQNGHCIDNKLHAIRGSCNENPVPSYLAPLRM